MVSILKTSKQSKKLLLNHTVWSRAFCPGPAKFMSFFSCKIHVFYANSPKVLTHPNIDSKVKMSPKYHKSDVGDSS